MIIAVFWLILFANFAFAQACIDCDNDGIIDSTEQVLAEKFAPIIIHDKNEKHLPTNVDIFLTQCDLYFYDDACSPDVDILIKNHPSQNDLISQQINKIYCGSAGVVNSNCTRSLNKQRTYYLSDVNESLKLGSLNTNEWTTYFHCYLNNTNGVTIQYWRFYASDIVHGGDWECVQVFLDRSLTPVFCDLPGHDKIDRFNWALIKKENNHPLIYSELGGHSSKPYLNQIGIKQETWSQGKVRNLDGTFSKTGRLLNVGEKTMPLNNQYFVQYSGLWGSPGTFYFTSGYWSPSYNETAMNELTQFITAWCNEMLNKNKEYNGIKECYPCSASR